MEHFFSLMDWKGLYLTGGTCLAEFYFGHRISVDLDLFTQEAALFEEAARSLGDEKLFPTWKIQKGKRALHFAQFFLHPDKDKEPVKVDLVLDSVPHLADPLKIGKVWIDSLDDILANKMGCLISRNEVKDYLDLYYLLPASHLTAREALEQGLKKDGGLDPLILSSQMEFLFRLPDPTAGVCCDARWDEVQFFFRKLQKEFLDLIKPVL